MCIVLSSFYACVFSNVVKVYKYGVLGASNAGKLGEALKSKGKDVVVVAKGGWRPSKQGVEELLKEMDWKISEDRVVIFYGMDNAVFTRKTRMGTGPSLNLMIRRCTM